MVDEEKPKKNIGKFIKIMLVIIAIALSTLIIIYKVYNPDFNIWFVITLVALFVLIPIVSIYWNNIVNLFSRGDYDDGFILPPPISDEECWEMFKNVLEGPRYANFPKKIIEDGSETVGDPSKSIMSDIYTVKVTGYYPDSENNKEVIYCAIINKHYPHQKRKLLVNPSEQKIEQVKNQMATYPQRKPNRKVTISENALTGSKTTAIEENYESLETEKEKEEEI